MRLLSTLFALLCLAPGVCRAQLTTITASHLNVGGQPIPSGMVTATPEDANANPIPFAQGGGGLNSPTAYSCSINNGGIIGTCQWPDSALTTPANICYSVTVIKTTAPARSYTLPKVCGITGSSWALDTYGPPAQTTAVQPLQVTNLGTAAAPNPCLVPSVYMRTSNGGEFYICPSGVPVLVTGNSGNSVQKSGDTMTGPLVLPGDPTLALQASTKQYVDAHGGNTSACPLNNATNICITDSPYNAVGDGTTNNYAAFNAAIAALATQPGCGTIWGPNGTYEVDGALQDPSGANALLPLPKIANYSNNMCLISFRGFRKSLGDTPATGFVIETAHTGGGNFIGGYDSATGGGYPPFTNVWLDLEDATLLGPQNPDFVMVNASAILDFTYRDILVGAVGSTSTLPTNAGGWAIKFPSLGNGVRLVGEGELAVGGFYNGIQTGEHTHITSYSIANYINALVVDNGTSVGAPSGYQGNSVQIDTIWFGPGSNQIVGGSNKTVLRISNANFESGGSLAVDDPSNNVYGIVDYAVAVPGNGYNYCTLPTSGGANLKLNPLWCSGSATLPQALENWQSLDGSGSTLANTGTDSTNSAALTNVTWASSSGFASNVATYNGTNSSALPASATNTSFDGTQPFSACASFNTTTFTGFTQEYLMSNLSLATGNPGWRIALTGSTSTANRGVLIYFSNSISGGNFIEVYTAANVLPVAGTFTKLCMTYHGNKQASGITLYVNGSPVALSVASNTLTGSMATTAPLYIGSEIDGTNVFSGAIGKVEVWPVELTAAQIANY